MLEIPPELLTFGLYWPFDLKNNRLLLYDKLYHVVKISLKLWPVGDRQTDRQTDRRTKSTDQYTWKIFNFVNKKGEIKNISDYSRLLKNPVQWKTHNTTLYKLNTIHLPLYESQCHCTPPMKIDNFRNYGLCCPFGPCWPQK